MESLEKKWNEKGVGGGGGGRAMGERVVCFVRGPEGSTFHSRWPVFLAILDASELVGGDLNARVEVWKSALSPTFEHSWNAMGWNWSYVAPPWRSLCAEAVFFGFFEQAWVLAQRGASLAFDEDVFQGEGATWRRVSEAMWEEIKRKRSGWVLAMRGARAVQVVMGVSLSLPLAASRLRVRRHVHRCVGLLSGMAITRA